MQSTHFTGWDIGGAHLKVAGIDDAGMLQHVHQFATPLWQGLDKLDAVMPEVIKIFPDSPTRHAVTMTAELVDIFPNRAAGVQTLSTLCQRYLGNDIDLYATGHGFINLAANELENRDVASANWYASGSMVATCIDSGVFIDIGSTTTDIIPVHDKRLLTIGHNDQQRMQHDELVYSGVIRTSLMALARRVPFAGHWQGVAAEHFATTADVYRLLGWLDEQADMMDTADGAGKNYQASMTRLARMVGADKDDFSEQHWLDLAHQFAEQQLAELEAAVKRVLLREQRIAPVMIGAGAGRFLIKQLAERLQFDYADFSDLLSCSPELEEDCNVCAPAVALAQLNRMRCQA